MDVALRTMRRASRGPEISAVGWGWNKRFAWDQSSALKRELWSTAKVPTPIDAQLHGRPACFIKSSTAG
ncbi:hypothetical protein BN2475_190082 [Paraburkholderia ribeironis]|uniref:Uncharacterized protein n=1 Tax=Paraburkholderia ribeironis TaxID=1247936 RepID=A0A1N7RVK3_9BURK|nr:hypothetical protein BN2475_190082 [Paraburkholderia ribeironis]